MSQPLHPIPPTEEGELQSTLGELRALVRLADEAHAPDACRIYVTLATNGATRHGSPLRTITAVHPGAPS